jgi:hypothetical protein
MLEPEQNAQESVTGVVSYARNASGNTNFRIYKVKFKPLQSPRIGSDVLNKG